MPSSRPFIVLIDGPSGAGKTTLARGIIAQWRGDPKPTLIRLDDVYRGWEGLATAAPHLAEHLLRPLRETGRGRWQRYDWYAGDVAEWRETDASVPLIVEGTGALTAATAPLADLRIWVDAPDEIRKPRALARDGELYAAHWDMWDTQYERHLAAQNPAALADIRVDGARATASTVSELAATVERMSTAETASHEYIVEYVDGPLSGTTDRREKVDGTFEDRIDAYVAVDGLPSQLEYVAVESREIGGTLFVKYAFDEAGSDPVTPDDDANNIT